MSMDTPPFDPSDYSYVIGIGKDIAVDLLYSVAMATDVCVYDGRFWYHFLWMLLCLFKRWK